MGIYYSGLKIVGRGEKISGIHPSLGSSWPITGTLLSFLFIFHVIYCKPPHCLFLLYKDKDERECKSLSTVTFLLIQNHERIEIRKIEIVNRLCPFSSWLNVNMSSQILSLSSFVSVYIFFALVRM